METDYDKTHWATPCPKGPRKMPPVGLRYISIPAVLGDDQPGSEVAPTNGRYANAIVKYEANGAIYIYSAEGIPVKIKEGEQNG